MTEQLKPCPFCGSPARLNRSTGESLWSHDQVEWTQVQCTNEDCGVATENRCEGWEPTPVAAWNTRALTTSQPAQATPEPIPMVLHCPKCGMQHIDGEEWEDDPHDIEQGRIRTWKNEPHRSHLCHGCGTIWRPADVPTTGVRAISTKGKADTWEPGQATQQATGEPVGRCLTEEEQARTTLRDPVVWFGGAPRGKTLFTHPAPGVPEDVLAILDECRNALMECDRDGDYALIDRIDALAAAQAKGGE